MRNNTIFKLLIVLILVLSQVSLHGDQKRFQIELTGNYLFASPDHLNYLPETELKYLKFFFDPVYEGKTSQGVIESLKLLFTINSRLKYALSTSWSISVGIFYLWRTLKNEYSVTYTRNEEWRILRDSLIYREFVTKVNGYALSLGIHYNLNISKRNILEFSLAGGPLFTRVNFIKDMSQSLVSLNEGEYPFYSGETTLEMEGSGTGISLLASIKLQHAFSRFFGVAIGGGYAWQRVFSLEGEGSETIDGQHTSYNGEWGIVKENIQTSAGQTELVFPSNNWDYFKQKSENFNLDLSGFYLSLGFYFRL